MLSGRISSLRDDSGAIFIDRDPTLFGIILNYLRTRDIDIKQCDLRILRHEAEYYNISPLIRRLVLCEDLNHSSCGDVWFYAHLIPPSMCMSMFHAICVPFRCGFYDKTFLLFVQLCQVKNRMKHQQPQQQQQQ